MSAKEWCAAAGIVLVFFFLFIGISLTRNTMEIITLKLRLETIEAKLKSWDGR